MLGYEELHLSLCRISEFNEENSVQQERKSGGNNVNVIGVKDVSS